MFDVGFLFDLEATGLSPYSSRVISIAWVTYARGNDGIFQKVGTFESLVNPQTHIPTAVTALTGITNTDVRRSESFANVWKRLNAWCRTQMKNIPTNATCACLAHNGFGYDVPLLISEIDRSRDSLGQEESFEAFMKTLRVHYVIDTLYVARRWEFKHSCHTCRLGDLYFAFTGDHLVNAHNALADVEAMFQIFLHPRRFQCMVSAVNVSLAASSKLIKLAFLPTQLLLRWRDGFTRHTARRRSRESMEVVHKRKAKLPLNSDRVNVCVKAHYLKKAHISRSIAARWKVLEKIPLQHKTFVTCPRCLKLVSSYFVTADVCSGCVPLKLQLNEMTRLYIKRRKNIRGSKST